MERYIDKEIDKKREIIYEIIIVGLPLTKEVLKLYYFTDEEIKTLVDNDVLKEVNSQKYCLNDTEGLYRYGIKQLSLNHAKYANECFRRCYQLNPNDRKSCLQLIIIELKKRNYYAVYKMLESLDMIDPEKYQKENDLYLYLLNIIARCDVNKRERVCNIKLEDILELDDENDFDKLDENNIKDYIMNEKYKIGLKFLNDLIARKEVYVTKYMFLKELIIQIIIKEQILKGKMLDAVRNKNYNFIINCIERKISDKAIIDKNDENGILNKLNPVDKKIYLITKALIKIKQDRVIPQIEKDFPATLDEAIAMNNFEMAKKINISYLKYRERVFEEDIVYLLLEDINNTIKEIRDEQNMIAIKQLMYSCNGTRKSEIVETNILDCVNCSKENKVNDIDEVLLSVEDLAYSIKETGISLRDAIKIYGLFKEQVLLVKLVYVRDYYNEVTEESYLMGDELLQEVENDMFKTEEIENIIVSLKEKRNINIPDVVSNRFVKKREI